MRICNDFKKINKNTVPSLVVHAGLQSQHSRGKHRKISEFKSRQMYRARSRIARAIQRNPVPKNKQKEKHGGREERRERERDTETNTMT